LQVLFCYLLLNVKKILL